MMTTGTGTESATWYYVGSFGQLGPLTLGEIEELVDGGVVERETYVWNPAMPSWLPASQVPQLATALGRRAPYLEPPPTPPGASRAAAPPSQNFARPTYATPPAPSNAAPPAFATLPVAAPKASSLSAAYAAYASPYGMASDRSRTLAGVLNILLPGIGRLYLGYSALGVIQLVATILSCGLLYVWGVVDGILMLTGQVKIDGYGRILND